MDYNLTPHFKISEFLRSDRIDLPFYDLPLSSRISNLTATRPDIVSNIHLVANTLERIRHDVFGDRPIIITSGYRTKLLNDIVGGVKCSDHMFGLAVDISDPLGKYYRLLSKLKSRYYIRYISHHPKRHYTHISFLQYET